jgi:4'-phosphopantetheinyl transferase
MPNNGLTDRLPLPEGDEAQVWIGLLSEVSPSLPDLERFLSAEEKGKAARFLRAEDRSRYVAAHGMLRHILARYLSVAPAGLEFAHSAFGKPALDRRAGQPAITFNLAHSGDAIACAVALDHRIGVDIEAVRTDLDIMGVAEGQFSDREAAALRTIDPSERTEAFFRCWTRKEAYVKARGEGLGLPLNQFAVAFGREEPPRMQWAADDPAAPTRWSMFDLDSSPGYAGAVVVEGLSVRLRRLRWTFSA